MLMCIKSLYYISFYCSRVKNRRGRPRVVSRLHTNKGPSKVNRRPRRKPGISSNVHVSNTETYRMGKMKQHAGVHVKDSEQKDCSSSCRVGIMISSGEEVVRRIRLSYNDV